MIKLILINSNSPKALHDFTYYLKEFLKLKSRKSYTASLYSSAFEVSDKLFSIRNLSKENQYKIVDNIVQAGYYSNKYYWEERFEKKIKNFVNKYRLEEGYIIVTDFKYVNTYEYLKKKFPIFTVKINDKKVPNDTKGKIPVDYLRFIINLGDFSALENDVKYFVENILGE